LDMSHYKNMVHLSLHLCNTVKQPHPNQSWICSLNQIKQDTFFTHPLTSIYKANITCYFKCHSQSNLKFIKDFIKITCFDLMGQSSGNR
jgi:hypothetical protein